MAMKQTFKQIFERESIEDIAQALIEECPSDMLSLLLAEMNAHLINELYEHD
jgi:hypothetical protein